MGITADLSQVSEIYSGVTPIQSVYKGGTLVWQARVGLDYDFDWDSAHTSQYAVMFVGSHTEDGFFSQQPDPYVDSLVRYIAQQVPGVDVYPPPMGSFDPSETGLSFINVGIGYTTSADYIHDSAEMAAATVYPKLIIHTIGSNDYAQQKPLNQFKSHLSRSIDRAEEATTLAQTRLPVHLFVHSFERRDVTHPALSWAEYGQAIKEVCAQRDNCLFLDVSARFVQLEPSPGAYLQPDGIHATEKGKELLGWCVAEGMGLEGLPADRSGASMN